MSDVLGETLRPGGFQLTQKAIEICKLTSKDKILDLGCGRGATISYLYNNYSIKAVGIDPSEKLLNIAKANCDFADLVRGFGETLPFDNESFDCVIAECTLSLMDDLNETIQEVNRVLKKKGWFVITDVFSKNPDALSELEGFSFHSCMRGLHDLDKLQQKIEKAGFKSVYLEDCSDLLKELLVSIVFTYGSMDRFWSKATDNESCGLESGFQEKLKLCKPGYFMLIALKGEI
jgi:SAM-dependent methyltransferase